ncbi:MAG: 3-isopropylmalate dehydratase small subunit [Actinomycetota bacterium]
MNPVRVVSGAISVLDRTDVDTDQIIPKQFLKRIERTGFGEFLFYDWIRSGEISLQPNPILVAGRNFGCGSSREHAVWAIQQFGFNAVIAPSFADIFYQNSTKNGLLAVALPESDVRAVMASGSASIDLLDQTVSFGAPPAGPPVTVPFDIDATIKHRLLQGLDEIGLTLTKNDLIAAYESKRAWPAPSTGNL